MHVALLIVVFTFACAAPSLDTGGQSSDLPPRRADPLPPPSGPLEVGPLRDATLGDWVDELVRLTGQSILVSERVQGILETKPDLRGLPESIPPDHVYPLVEGLLVDHDLYLVIVSTGSDPLLSLRGGNFGLGAPQPFHRIAQEDLHLLRLHPALIMAVLIELPNTDVRQLTTSLRGMLTDVTKQAILPTGEHSIVVRGMGHFVDGIVGVLLDIEASNARTAETRRLPALDATPQPER